MSVQKKFSPFGQTVWPARGNARGNIWISCLIIISSKNKKDIRIYVTESRPNGWTDLAEIFCTNFKILFFYIYLKTNMGISFSIYKQYCYFNNINISKLYINILDLMLYMSRCWFYWGNLSSEVSNAPDTGANLRMEYLTYQPWIIEVSNIR